MKNGIYFSTQPFDVSFGSEIQHITLQADIRFGNGAYDLGLYNQTVMHLIFEPMKKNSRSFPHIETTRTS